LQGEGRQVVPFKGKLNDKGELSKFVVVESLPLTIPFNSANTERIFGSMISRHLILIAKPDDLKPNAKVYKAFAEAAKRSRADQKFVFVTADTSDEEGEPVLEFFGVKKEKAPMVIAFQVEPQQLKWWCGSPPSLRNIHIASYYFYLGMVHIGSYYYHTVCTKQWRWGHNEGWGAVVRSIQYA
jgi:hypothetical protein